MSFLDNTGLAYFYSKLKEKFIQSVNGNLPTDGNVVITNVATADNLTSSDAIESYDTYISRTSGGATNITSGDAYLAYIDGNVDIEGRTIENLNVSASNNLNVTSNISLWNTQINVTGTYIFSYLKPSSLVATPNWIGTGEWYFEGEAVPLALYGLTVSGLIPPSITITNSTSEVTEITVTPTTWMNAVSEEGIYNFYYRGASESEESFEEGQWFLNNNLINLDTYGITITGTPLNGDEIVVTYIEGTPNSTITANYTAPSQGIIKVAKPTSFVSTGYNQFNKDSTDFYLTDASIENGEIISSTGTYVCFCKAIPGAPWGYIAHSVGGYIIDGGWCETLPQIGVTLNQVQEEQDLNTTELYSITFDSIGYFVVAVSNKDDLCIHTRWDSEEDEVDEEYTPPSVITLPTQDTEGNILPLGNYGMPAVYNTADRLNLETSTYIQRIGRYENTTENMNTVIAMGVPYDWDINYIYYVLSTPVTYSVDTNSLYVVNDFGTEEFTGTIVAVGAETIYGENLRNKLKTDVLTISEQYPSLGTSELKQVYTNLQIFDKIYPVGSIYMSVNNVNPMTLFGGTWERITGCFLLAGTDTGANGGNSNANIKPGYTGGEASHKLTTTEIPAHTHGQASLTGYFRIRRYGTSTPGGDYMFAGGGIVQKTAVVWSGSHALVGTSNGSFTNPSYDQATINASHTHTSVGGNGAHNNMPPYLAVYVWKRTA